MQAHGNDTMKLIGVAAVIAKLDEVLAVFDGASGAL